MTQKSFFTVGQVADIYDAPAWKVRRIVDSLGPQISRAGLYRLIPREMLPAIGARLQQSQSTPEPDR